MNESNDLVIRLYALKALVARGDSFGFTKLLELIKNRCEEVSEQMDDFSDLFGLIVTKPDLARSNRTSSGPIRPNGS